MSIARQRFAVRVPIRPKPTTSRVFSARSTGTSFQRSCQRSSRTAASWYIAFLASPYIMKTACSATEHRVRRADHHQRDAARGQRRDLDRVVADPDARRDPQPRRRGDFRRLQRRQRQRDAVGVAQREPAGPAS